MGVLLSRGATAGGPPAKAENQVNQCDVNFFRFGALFFFFFCTRCVGRQCGVVRDFAVIFGNCIQRRVVVAVLGRRFFFTAKTTKVLAKKSFWLFCAYMVDGCSIRGVRTGVLALALLCDLERLPRTKKKKKIQFSNNNRIFFLKVFGVC